MSVHHRPLRLAAAIAVAAVLGATLGAPPGQAQSGTIIGAGQPDAIPNSYLVVLTDAAVAGTQHNPPSWGLDRMRGRVVCSLSAEGWTQIRWFVNGNYLSRWDDQLSMFDSCGGSLASVRVDVSNAHGTVTRSAGVACS